MEERLAKRRHIESNLSLHRVEGLDLDLNQEHLKQYLIITLACASITIASSHKARNILASPPLPLAPPAANVNDLEPPPAPRRDSLRSSFQPYRD